MVAFWYLYRTRTNFQGMYISRRPQIQHFHDFIFQDRWPYFDNDYTSRNELQGLNFSGMHVIRENSKIYVPQKFERVQYSIHSLQ